MNKESEVLDSGIRGYAGEWMKPYVCGEGGGRGGEGRDGFSGIRDYLHGDVDHEVEDVDDEGRGQLKMRSEGEHHRRHPQQDLCVRVGGGVGGWGGAKG